MLLETLLETDQHLQSGIDASLAHLQHQGSALQGAVVGCRKQHGPATSTAPTPPTPTPPHPEKSNNMTFLRGTLISDSDGLVVFQTIVPGWYPGKEGMSSSDICCAAACIRIA